MRVRAKKLRTFDADSPITKSGAFGGAGNYTYVVEHKSPVSDDRRVTMDQGPETNNPKKDRVFRNEQVGLIA